MVKVKRNIPRKDHKKLHFLLIAAVAFLVYANSLSNDFVFDDQITVLGDPTIKTLSSISRYFVGEQTSFNGVYYRPVVSSSLAVDYASWAFRPFGYHLTNVLIHVLNCILFYWLLRVMFEQYQSRFRDYATFIAAAVFAVHPIHTEVVAWVSGRTDGLCFTFFILAFVFYLKYARGRGNLNLTLTVSFYLLSLLAKEMAITFPIAVILYDLIVNGLNTRTDFKQRAGVYSALVIVSIAYMALRWSVLKDTSQAQSSLYFYGKNAQVVVCTMLQTIPIYFKLAVVPVGMLYHYGGYMPYLSSPWELGVLSAIVLMAAMLAVAFYLRERIPAIAYALPFFLITLLPVSNIVPTMNLMADRFLYIPSISLSLVIAAAILKFCSEQNVRVILALSGLLIAVFGYMTIARNADWKTSDALYMSAADRRGTIVYTNIGTIYARRGQNDVAERYFRKALDLKSDHMLANTDLAVLFMATGKIDSAYYYAEKAHALHERSPEPMYVLAQLCARMQKMPEAILWLEKIQEVRPGYMNSVEVLRRLKDMRQTRSAMPGSQ